MSDSNIITMKTLTIAFSLIFLALGASASADAVEDESQSEPEYELPEYEFIAYVTLPKPTRSPMPKVKSQLVGTKFNIYLTVTKEGRAENVRLQRPLASYSNVDRMTFANQALQAVSKWRFQPARDADDKPVAVNVSMPIKVVKYGQIYRAMASLDFAETGHKN